MSSKKKNKALRLRQSKIVSDPKLKKTVSSQKNIPPIKSKNHIFQIISLSLKRTISFLIDFLAVMAVIFLLEMPFGLYLFYFTELDTIPSSPFKGFIADFHLLLIPLLLGLCISSVFKGKSLGCRLTLISVLSPQPSYLSLVGCTLKYIFMLGVPYLFFVLAYLPYLERSGQFTPPVIETSILLMLLLIVPLSIIWGEGRQGFHDLILGLSICQNKCKNDNYLPSHSIFSIFGCFVSTIIISIIIAVMFQNSSFFNKSLSYGETISGKIFDKSKLTFTEDVTNRIKQLVDNSEYSDYVKAVSVSFPMTFNSILLRKENLHIPKHSIIPTISLELGGKGLRKAKLLTFTFGDKIRSLKLNFNVFRIEARRSITIDMFSFETTSECLYYSVTSDSRQCSEEIFLRPVIFSWHSGVNTAD